MTATQTPQTTPEATAPKAKAAPIVITAAKGGDQVVAPIKGKIAKAIKATGKSLNAISREHGLNPSQMRRLSLDTVAKVDLPRAEAIAAALGVKVTDLFGAPSTKAAATPKAKAKAKATPKPATTRKPRTSRAAKGAAQAAKDKLAAPPAE